jgi:hypothetical protein
MVHTPIYQLKRHSAPPVNEGIMSFRPQKSLKICVIGAGEWMVHTNLSVDSDPHVIH